jgi:uncharacterized protein YgiM (DUF1202 family)
LLLVTLMSQPLFSFAEEADFIAEDTAELADIQDDPDALSAQEELQAPSDEVRYVATATFNLKMRKGPGLEYSGAGQIRDGDTVYILELGAEWTKIRTERATGYVLTKYLGDIREYDAASGTAGAALEFPQDVLQSAETDAAGFKQGYKAYAVKAALLKAEPDSHSATRTSIRIYDQVIVSHVQGDWCYAQYKGYTGYILNSNLFKWDRIDPYAGPIPGNIVYPTMAFVKHTTDILDYKSTSKSPKVLKTVNPGSALCVEKPDEQGRYKTPYWRTTGYITQDDIAYTLDVVPYDQAQVGDLISVMTTYYAVGIHTLQYQGRNWNIYLSTSMISGSVVQPGAQFNVNQCIGPYRKSTGYKPAPIASPTALWGYGGGTCQVNTTLYNTVIQVPILVNHRKVHANVGAKYFLKGFDAAVGGGDINMIFTNTLPYPIRFNYFISDGVLTCCIFRAG